MSTPLDRPTRPGASTPPAYADGAYGGPLDRPTAPAAAERTGSRPVAGDPRRRRRYPLAWLPWAALALAGLLVLLSLLVVNAVDDDGPAGPAGDSLGQVGGAEGASGSSGGSAAQGGAGASGLTAGGQQLLGLAAGGGLGAVAGQAVQGTARVESVVSDEGFWVGTSATDRVFVFLTPQARQSSGESGFQVQAGQTVAVTGVVAPLAEQPAVADGVAADEGLEQLGQQAHFVRADAVQLG